MKSEPPKIGPAQPPVGPHPSGRDPHPSTEEIGGEERGLELNSYHRKDLDDLRRVNNGVHDGARFLKR